MKTLKITDLKKEILVVENSDELDFYEITPRILSFNMKDGSIRIFKGNFTLLGNLDEIKEDDVVDLVDPVGIGWFEDYQDRKNGMFKYALKSFNSALEKNLFWENNVSKQLAFIGNVSEIDKQIALKKQERRWQQAQEKTFDKNRTLIFLKN